MIMIVKQTSLTSGMKQALSYKQVPIPLLAKYLPTFDEQNYGKSRLIYAIIGRHEDGRYALYIGSTPIPQNSHTQYKNLLRAVQRWD